MYLVNTQQLSVHFGRFYPYVMPLRSIIHTCSAVPSNRKCTSFVLHRLRVELLLTQSSFSCQSLLDYQNDLGPLQPTRRRRSYTPTALMLCGILQLGPTERMLNIRYTILCGIPVIIAGPVTTLYME